MKSLCLGYEYELLQLLYCSKYLRCCGLVDVLVFFRGELIFGELVLGYVGCTQRWRDVGVPAVEIGHR